MNTLNKFLILIIILAGLSFNLAEAAAPPGKSIIPSSIALQGGGAVLDGRDIGTVIAPEAEVKLFVVASVPARAERRFREMQAAGRAVSLAEISADLEARDKRDRERAEAPLTAAPDAVLLDTSDLGREEAIAAAIAIAEARQADSASPQVEPPLAPR